jgi:hypothetical protein
VISVEDYLFFVDESIDGMVAILEQLGDDLANRRPDLPDANSPFALLTHCLGVMEYWVGYLVAGRDIQRDRDAEFRATGDVADLVERARTARRQLERDLHALDPWAPPRRPPILPEDAELPIGRSQGGALIHVYEELQQHRGQMEITRDVLLAASTPPG